MSAYLFLSISCSTLFNDQNFGKAYIEIPICSVTELCWTLAIKKKGGGQ